MLCPVFGHLNRNLDIKGRIDVGCRRAASQNGDKRDFLQVRRRRHGSDGKKNCRNQADREEYRAKRNRPTFRVWSLDPLVPPSLADARVAGGCGIGAVLD
jgi:hypothetical protein